MSYWSIGVLAFYLSAILFRMYLSNQSELDATLAQALIASTSLFLIIALCLSGLCAWLRFSPDGRFTKTLVLSIAVIFIYESILFALVPELDGEAAATPTPFLYVIDAVILVLAVWTLSNATRIPVQFVSSILLFSFAVAFLGLAAALITDRPQAAMAAEENFDRLPLSKDFNVIHILMDALQATEFDDAMAALPNKDAYSGFTWFRNTVGASYRTIYSKPAIFTGKIYTESEQFSEYYQPGRITFLDVVVANDYDVTSFDGPDPRRLRGTRVKTLAEGRSSVAQNIAELIDIALIRIVPFALKDIVLNDYAYFVTRLFRRDAPVGNEIHRTGFLKFAESLYVDNQEGTKPKYYFMHVLYPHAPYTHNADCSYTGGAQKATEEQARLEIHCAVRDFAGLLDRLRDLGVYDNTLIVFHSDTGEKFLLKSDSLQGAPLPPRVTGGSPFALLAVKPAGATRAFRVSEKPASLQDIPNTVLGQLGLPKSFDGIDLFEAVDLNERERIYWAEAQGTFGVTGDVYDPESWRQIADYAPTEIPKIKPGDWFGIGIFTPQGRDFFKSGWSSVLRDGIETIGPKSVMTFPVADGQQISKLTFHARLGATGALPLSYKLNGGATKLIEVVYPLERKPMHFNFSIPVESVPATGELIVELLTVPTDEAGPSNFSFRVMSLNVY